MRLGDDMILAREVMMAAGWGAQRRVQCWRTGEYKACMLGRRIVAHVT
jgi:hypothetical protein